MMRLMMSAFRVRIAVRWTAIMVASLDSTSSSTNREDFVYSCASVARALDPSMMLSQTFKDRNLWFLMICEDRSTAGRKIVRLRSQGPIDSLELQLGNSSRWTCVMENLEHEAISRRSCNLKYLIALNSCSLLSCWVVLCCRCPTMVRVLARTTTWGTISCQQSSSHSINFDEDIQILEDFVHC